MGPFITRLDSPGNWTIESDWFRLASQIRFASVGERLFQATIPDASRGEHWIRFVDTNLCLGKDPNDPTEPFVTSGVSINDVDLTRVLSLVVPGSALPRPGIAFTVSADGAVRP